MKFKPKNRIETERDETIIYVFTYNLSYISLNTQYLSEQTKMSVKNR